MVNTGQNIYSPSSTFRRLAQDKTDLSEKENTVRRLQIAWVDVYIFHTSYSVFSRPPSTCSIAIDERRIIDVLIELNIYLCMGAFTSYK